MNGAGVGTGDLGTASGWRGITGSGLSGRSWETVRLLEKLAGDAIGESSVIARPMFSKGVGALCLGGDAASTRTCGMEIPVPTPAPLRGSLRLRGGDGNCSRALGDMATLSCDGGVKANIDLPCFSDTSSCFFLSRLRRQAIRNKTPTAKTTADTLATEMPTICAVLSPLPSLDEDPAAAAAAADEEAGAWELVEDGTDDVEDAEDAGVVEESKVVRELLERDEDVLDERRVDVVFDLIEVEDAVSAVVSAMLVICAVKVRVLCVATTAPCWPEHMLYVDARSGVDEAHEVTAQAYAASPRVRPVVL